MNLAGILGLLTPFLSHPTSLHFIGCPAGEKHLLRVSLLGVYACNPETPDLLGFLCMPWGLGLERKRHPASPDARHFLLVSG